MALGLEAFTILRGGSKSNEQMVTTPVAYPTGFMPLDYLNGQRVKVYDDNDNLIEEYDSVGFVEGTMITVISDPGLGKTTLSQQIATEIISNFDDAFVVHEDIEQASHINRVFNITSRSPRWIKNHYVIYQDAHTETFASRFMDHAKLKLNNRKNFEYDTGLKDMFGNKIKRLIPTVVILDSLAVMRSEDGSFGADDKSKIKDDIDNTANNNMFGARNAKFTSELLKQIIPYAKKANIILIVINQINRRINSGFIPQARELVGLGDSESLAGGRASLYLANNVIRLKNKQMLKKDKDYAINGHIIEATYLKSRTAASYVPFELIFDKQNGYSQTLTLFHLGFSQGFVKKQGNKYYVDGLENITFSKKDCMKVSAEHPEILNALYDHSLKYLQQYLGVDNGGVDDNSEDPNAYIDIMNSLMND